MVVSKHKIVVGFSGGVDSLVTCLLLKKSGYEVYAVTLIFNNSHKTPAFQEHVKKAAALLNINHEFFDVRSSFRRVLDYFKQGYLSGKTPNPCVFCNQHVKWPKLFEYAARVGALKVATGHYAQKKALDENTFFTKGLDGEKDQSFFLWSLTPEQVEQIELPLGKMYKAEVKEVAKKNGFTVFSRQKESTGPCFTGKNYRHTLKGMLTDTELPGKGNFLSEDGEVLGRHDGYLFYTISQRKGLGLNLKGKHFVKKLIPESNQVVLTHAGRLWSREFYLKNWTIHYPAAVENCEVEIKIRYRSQKAKGVLKNAGDRLCVKLSEPEWAVTPGQTAAVYMDEYLVGGGYIDEVTN